MWSPDEESPGIKREHGSGDRTMGVGFGLGLDMTADKIVREIGDGQITAPDVKVSVPFMKRG